MFYSIEALTRLAIEWSFPMQGVLIMSLDQCIYAAWRITVPVTYHCHWCASATVMLRAGCQKAVQPVFTRVPAQGGGCEYNLRPKVSKYERLVGPARV